MADYDTLPKPPTDTVVPGTGSAVQVADMNGVKWKFDDQEGNWVNLKTGEAVTPQTFSQMAGRSGNAARDTVALAQAMRREEAALTPPTLRPPPPSPVALSQSPPPAAPLAPPTIGTGTTLPQAPVIPPNGQGILAPYSAPELARVAGQRPVPSTRVPPTPAAQEFYRQQLANFYLQRGMKPADVAKMIGIGTQPAVKPIHVGDALVNPQTGQEIYRAPVKAMTPMQQLTVERWKREDQQKADALELSKKRFERQLTPQAKERIKVWEDDLKSIRTAMNKSDLTPDQVNTLTHEHSMLWDNINREFSSPSATTNAPAVTKPATAKAAPSSDENDFVTVTNPSGKRVRIRKAQLDEALASGYKQ